MRAFKQLAFLLIWCRINCEITIVPLYRRLEAAYRCKWHQPAMTIPPLRPHLETTVEFGQVWPSEDFRTHHIIINIPK